MLKPGDTVKRADAINILLDSCYEQSKGNPRLHERVRNLLASLSRQGSQFATVVELHELVEASEAQVAASERRRSKAHPQDWPQEPPFEERA